MRLSRPVAQLHPDTPRPLHGASPSLRPQPSPATVGPSPIPHPPLLLSAASPSKAARAIGHAPIPPPHAKADDGARAGPRSSTPDGVPGAAAPSSRAFAPRAVPWPGKVPEATSTEARALRVDVRVRHAVQTTRRSHGCLEKSPVP